MAGLIGKIKNDVKKAGANKGKFIHFREGQKVRVRFLVDMDDGIEVQFHDSFELGVNVPCQEIFDRACPYCERDELRTRSQYIWPVYNYDAKEVQLFMFAVNNCSPIPALIAMYENYGSITDRDYVITKSGKQQNTTYAVIPMDVVKFRNEKAKPYSGKTILKMLDKAFPSDEVDEDEVDDEEEVVRTPRKNKPATKNASTKKTKTKPVDDEDDYDDESWSDDDETPDYTQMSAIELYRLCKTRDIEAAPKKPNKYYITLLTEDDKAQDDWSDDEDDDWEDEE